MLVLTVLFVVAVFAVLALGALGAVAYADRVVDHGRPAARALLGSGSLRTAVDARLHQG